MAQQDYFNAESNQISKYNDAGLSISRLHETWIRCSHYARVGDFKSWKTELDMAWLELFPDVKRQSNHEDIIRQNTLHRIKVARARNRVQQFFALMERQEFLRELQDLAGKAGVYVDEDEEGFE